MSQSLCPALFNLHDSGSTSEGREGGWLQGPTQVYLGVQESTAAAAGYYACFPADLAAGSRDRRTAKNQNSTAIPS